MKLTIKTLQQKVFTIEAESTSTVLQLKSLIETSQGFTVSQQKLIHSGKILADESVLQNLNIQEKDFLVVMITKPKATPAPTASTTTVASQPVAPSSPTRTTAAPVSAPVSTAPVPTAFDASTLATGNAYESAVSNLLEMGFPREQVVRAMRAAFNNPDRAAEYLMTGIPESIARELAPPASAQPVTGAVPEVAPGANPTPPANQPFNMFEAANAQARAANAPPSTGTGGADPLGGLGALRNSPQFQQLRQLVQTQPELLQPLLQQLGQQNPELLSVINSNPEQFLSMFAGEGGEDFEGEGGEAGEAGGQYITISAEDDAAINRLVALGFAREQAAEAFLACDKNEELAANYLFDSMGNEGW